MRGTAVTSGKKSLSSVTFRMLVLSKESRLCQAEMSRVVKISFKIFSVELAVSYEPLWPFHHVAKLVEQVSAVVRSGRSFRVVLDAEGRQAAMSQAGNGVII